MNLPFFIAKKAASTNTQSFSGLIIRIATVAVALSLAVMIVSTAVISGFKHQIGEKIFGFWGHIHITHISSCQINRSSAEAVPIAMNEDFYPALDTIGRVEFEENWTVFGMELPWARVRKTAGGIKHVQAFALKPGIIKTKKEIEGIVLKGVGADFDWSFFDKFIVEGERLHLSDTAVSNEIIVSKQTAARLELEVGEEFIFHFVQEGEALRRKFKVVGFYKTGLEEYDRKFAIIDLRKAQELLNWDSSQVGGFEVYVDDLGDIDVLADYIYLDYLPNDLCSVSIRSKYPAIFDWLALQDINEAVILVLMLIVGLINMVTALMILILERTNMIGTLKALGLSDWGIRSIFLYHAARIILVGLFWGNLVGIGFCFLQEKFSLIKLSEENYYLSEAPVELNFWTILLLNLGALVSIMLFLLVPSWLVTRISPVKAIRFK